MLGCANNIPNHSTENVKADGADIIIDYVNISTSTTATTITN